jgi:pyruvoyl-dependent arginine decarboxylase (PvlArgDC)
VERKLSEILEQLYLALTARGFDTDTANGAVSAAIAQCLPSHQALLTLAMEHALRIRTEESAARFESERMEEDDIPW